jgi:Protein of unknown function (DUF4235)
MVNKTAFLLYRPLGLSVSIAGGLLASAMFDQVWKRITGEEEAPKATDANRGWPEVMLAAAAQGAVFAVVRAAADRGSATAFRRLTGSWPGRE